MKKTQDMTDTQFDEKIREMLSAPQEQLPEGLWEGIEARLDAATGQRRRGTVVVRRWIAGVSAAAAAVAIGLIVAHFVPSGSVVDGEMLAENVVLEASADDDADKRAAEAALGAAGEEGKRTEAENEVRFDVVKKKDAGLVAMAVVPAREEAKAVSASEAEGQSSGKMKEQATTAEKKENATEEILPEVETATTRVDVDAYGGEPECELKVDNSDIEAAYGKDESGTGRRAVPFEVTVGGNSFGGPDRNNGPRKMFSQGRRNTVGNTFVEGINSDTYGLPLSFGVGFRYGITKWLGVGIGLNYTMLSKKVAGTWYDDYEVPNEMEMKNSQHYIGIPVDVYFSIFRTRFWDAYATVGGAVEKCVSNRYSGTLDGESVLWTPKVGGVQTSVKAGLGVEFSPVKFLGIYIDPSVRYYFDNNQPRSSRTAQPLAFGVEAGVRFKL